MLIGIEYFEDSARLGGFCSNRPKPEFSVYLAIFILLIRPINLLMMALPFRPYLPLRHKEAISSPAIAFH